MDIVKALPVLLLLSTAPAVAQSSDRIVVSPQSNVCVTVHIDQRIWPRPLGPDSLEIFSGSLMAQLRNQYERRGGSISLPGRGRPDRFITNEHGDDLRCADPESDVLVVAHYRPRADGTAFIFDYRIGRGATTRTGRSEVDVAAAIRAGRIRGFTQRRTMAQIVYEDLLLSRAPMILNQLTIQRD